MINLIKFRRPRKQYITETEDCHTDEGGLNNLPLGGGLNILPPKKQIFSLKLLQQQKLV